MRASELLRQQPHKKKKCWYTGCSDDAAECMQHSSTACPTPVDHTYTRRARGTAEAPRSQEAAAAGEGAPAGWARTPGCGHRRSAGCKPERAAWPTTTQRQGRAHPGSNGGRFKKAATASWCKPPPRTLASRTLHALLDTAAVQAPALCTTVQGRSARGPALALATRAHGITNSGRQHANTPRRVS